MKPTIIEFMLNVIIMALFSYGSYCLGKRSRKRIDQEMKSSIKFRAKDHNWNWVYGFYHSAKGKHYINNTEVYGDTVCQYLGLNDSKNKEIYKGDIYKSHGVELVIQTGTFHISTGLPVIGIFTHRKGYIDYPFTGGAAKSCMIQDNIFDNKELKKQLYGE